MSRFVAFLLGLALLGISIYLGKNLLHLQQHGVSTMGTVVSAQTRHSVTVGGTNGIETDRAESAWIEFTPDGGKPIQFKSLFWSKQHVGEQVKILYNKDDPNDARTDGIFPWLGPLAIGILGLVSTLYGIGITDSGLQVDRPGWTVFRWFD